MASRLKAGPTRIVLDLLKKNTIMTRGNIYKASPREVIPSKRRVRLILQSLQNQHKVQAYLEMGKVKKVDNWVYKLNPMKERANFPHLAKSKRKCVNELKYVLSLGVDEPIIGLRGEEKGKEAKKFVTKDDVFDPTKE